MKKRFSIALTVLLMLFGINVSAQVNGGGKAIDNLDGIVNAVLEGSSETTADVNDDEKVNVADIVDFNNMATVNLNIKNTGSQSITISPRFRFVLSEGTTEAAWFEPFGAFPVINPGETLSIENVKIPNGKQFVGQTFAETGDSYPSNVVIYDANFISETIIPEMISSEKVFEEGGTYDIAISIPDPGTNPGTDPGTNPGTDPGTNPGTDPGTNPGTDPGTNPGTDPGPSIITINLNIINRSGANVSLDGDVCFVLGNPDVYGVYHGWEGVYNRTDHLYFGGFTLGAGASQVVTVTGELGGRSPLNSSLLSIAGRKSNVLLYVGGDSEVAIAESMSSNILFQNGGTYDVVITSYGSSPSPTPAPSPSDISINLNIINSSGRTISLDGDVVFVLGNPDIYGVYHGWDGPYNRTDHMYFGGFTLGAGASKVVTVTGELGGRSPLDPSWLSFAGRKSNVLLYIGGNSEVVICENMSPGVVFQNGGTYSIVFH